MRVLVHEPSEVDRDQRVFFLVCVYQLDDAHLNQISPVELTGFNPLDHFRSQKGSSALTDYERPQDSSRVCRDENPVDSAVLYRREVRNSCVWVDLSFTS